MITITCVCHAGVGTSAFATGLVKSALENLGYDKAGVRVECTELMGAKGLKSEVIVTTNALQEKVQKGTKSPVVGVASLVGGVDEMQAALAPYLEAACEAGKIKKK